MPTPFSRTALGAPFPSTCVRCQRKTDLVDLGAPELNGYGTVLLCTVCIGELVDVMGYIAKDTAERQFAGQRAEIDRLVTELENRPTLTDSRYEGLAHAVSALAARHPAGDPDPGLAHRGVAAGVADAPVGGEAADDAAAGVLVDDDDAGRDGEGDAGGADGALGEDAGRDDGAGGEGDPWGLIDRGAAGEDD